MARAQAGRLALLAHERYARSSAATRPRTWRGLRRALSQNSVPSAKGQAAGTPPDHCGRRTSETGAEGIIGPGRGGRTKLCAEPVFLVATLLARHALVAGAADWPDALRSASLAPAPFLSCACEADESGCAMRPPNSFLLLSRALVCALRVP